MSDQQFFGILVTSVLSFVGICIFGNKLLTALDRGEVWARYVGGAIVSVVFVVAVLAAFGVFG